MPDMYVVGTPGVQAAITATHRIVFKGDALYALLPQGRLISGTYARDPLNTGDLDVLRPGVLMGKRTSDSYYAPSIMGTLTVAAAAAATSLTVGAPTAVELVRRVGATGTFKMTGPPAAGGVVATETVTYSAINTTTGVITATAIVNAYIIGSFIQPTDGSEMPLTLVADGYGIKVTDQSSTNQVVQFPEFPIGGTLVASQIINWPTDAALQRWVGARLNDVPGGKFVLDYVY